MTFSGLEAPPPAPNDSLWRRLDRSLIVRGVIGFLTFILLSCFLYFQSQRIDIYSVGTIAPKEWVAPYDLKYEDKEQMALLRKEIVEGDVAVYRLSAAAIQEQLEAIQEEFNLHYRVNLHYDPGSLFVLQDQLKRHFTELRFIGLDLLSQPYFSKCSYYFPLPAGLDGAAPGEVVLPEDVWGYLIEKIPFTTYLMPTLANHLIQELQTATWNLVRDPIAEAQYRLDLESSIQEIHQVIPEGTKILDKGEVVSEFKGEVLEAYRTHWQQEARQWNPYEALAATTLGFIFTMILGGYLVSRTGAGITSNKHLTLVLISVLISLFSAKSIEGLWNTSFYKISIPYPLAYAPLPLPTMLLLSIIINPGKAAIIAGITTILLAIGCGIAESHFLIFNAIFILGVFLGVRSLKRRKDLFGIVSRGWLAAASFLLIWKIPFLLSFENYYGKLAELSISIEHLEGIFFPGQTPPELLSFGVVLLVSLAVTIWNTVLVVGILPLLESLFSLVTEISLIEYLDPTHPLLRRLSMEAPGTYQHSLVVANFAESAARAIGANSLFCRVATLYHDIGKLAHPNYFIENQTNGYNVHTTLTPIESAQTILSHISQGTVIAQQENLPRPIIDIIQQHHGTTKVEYFYAKQCECLGQRQLNDVLFHYAGPRPQTKEAVIIMICDSFEAVLRTITNINEATLDQLASKVIKAKTDQEQFVDSPITFKEVAQIQKAIVTTALAAYHGRISYPDPIPEPIVITSEESKKTPEAGTA